MLDLNIASSGKSSSSPVEKAAIDDSCTSNSSVLNVEISNTGGDEDSSSTRTLGFQFRILKNEEEDEEEEEKESGSSFVTKELFPMPGPPVAASASSSSRSAHWVDLGRDRSQVSILQHAQPQQQQQQQQQQVKKSRRGPRSRSSQYRGVTFYRRTGRWESHIWDCGKQVYLGGFDTAHAAARAYDRAAIKFRGVNADINFNLSDYDEDLKQMRNLTKEEFVHILRRQSTGFSRGSSKFRGVTRHKCGRWEARMGQFLGKKAYDKAAIKFSGREAFTNFELSSYEGETHPEADGEAIGHELDLDLSISQPTVCSPKRANNTMDVQFHFGSLESTDPKKARIDSHSSILGGQQQNSAMLSEHSLVWPALHRGFFPSSEERAAVNRHVFSSSAPPNWTWQMQGLMPMPLSLFTSAASSGFATTTTTTAAIASPPPSSTGHLQFPSPPATNYYSRR